MAGVLKVLFEVEPYDVPLNGESCCFPAVQGFFILQRKQLTLFPGKGVQHENHVKRQHPRV